MELEAKQFESTYRDCWGTQGIAEMGSYLVHILRRRLGISVLEGTNGTTKADRDFGGLG